MDSPQLRASDAEREHVADILREAAGDGRLSFEELDERLGQAYAAKTRGDLEPLIADLTGHGLVPTGPAGSVNSMGPAGPSGGVQLPVPPHQSSFAMMSTTSRKGAWLVPAQHTATASLGKVVLDLREAVLTSREVTIVANAFFGTVEVIAPLHMAVAVNGVKICGAFEDETSRRVPPPPPGAPVVSVRGLAVFGSVEVRRRDYRRRKKLGRRRR